MSANNNSNNNQQPARAPGVNQVNDITAKQLREITRREAAREAAKKTASESFKQAQAEAKAQGKTVLSQDLRINIDKGTIKGKTTTVDSATFRRPQDQTAVNVDRTTNTNSNSNSNSNPNIGRDAPDSLPPAMTREYVDPRHNQQFGTRKVGDIINEEVGKGDDGLYGSRRTYDNNAVKDFSQKYVPAAMAPKSYSVSLDDSLSGIIPGKMRYEVNFGGGSKGGGNGIKPEPTAEQNSLFGPTAPESKGVGPYVDPYKTNTPYSRPGDIIPQRLGTPVGVIPVDKKEDPSDVRTHMLTPFKNLARTGYEASKGFNDYEIYKDTYQNGEFPIKESSPTTTSILFDAGKDTIGDFMAGKGFSGGAASRAAAELGGANLPRTVGTLIGEAPLLALPVGEAFTGAKAAGTAGIKALKESSTIARIGSLTTKEGTMVGSSLRYGANVVKAEVEPVAATVRNTATSAGISAYKAGQTIKTGLTDAVEPYRYMDVKLPEIGPMPNFAVPQSIASTAGYVKLSAQMAPTVLAAAGRKGVDAIASKVEPYKYADVNFGSLKPTLPDSIVNSAIAKDARYLGTSAMMLPSTVGKAASSGLDEVTGFFGKGAS